MNLRVLRRHRRDRRDAIVAAGAQLRTDHVDELRLRLWSERKRRRIPMLGRHPVDRRFVSLLAASEKQLLDEGKADAIAFGKLFIANPDLPLRFAQGAPLNRPEPNTFYAHDPHGYIDYPTIETATARV